MKRKSVRNFVIIMIILFLLGSVRYIFSVVTDKSALSNMNQSVVTPEMIANRSSDLSISQAFLYSSSFKGDGFYEAKGNVKVLRIEDKYYIVFDKNFSVSIGPDLYVYLSQKQNYSSFDTSKAVNISKLKSTSGEQAYQISQDDYVKYNGAIVIWCKGFGIQFGRAELV